MADPYQNEFNKLTVAAEKSLQYPEVHLPHHMRLLRIWRYPSFEPYVSSMLFAPVERYAKSDSPVEVEVKWDRPFDAMRFHDPMKGLTHGFSTAPTMSMRQAELLTDQVELRIADLEKIQVPLMIDTTIGVDGEMFGVETFGLAAAVRLTWWSNIPAAWQPIVEWSKEMQEFQSAAFQRNSPTINAI